MNWIRVKLLKSLELKVLLSPSIRRVPESQLWQQLFYWALLCVWLRKEASICCLQLAISWTIRRNIEFTDCFWMGVLLVKNTALKTAIWCCWKMDFISLKANAFKKSIQKNSICFHMDSDAVFRFFVNIS